MPVVKHCGIRYSPPTLVIFYISDETGSTHRRSMPIRGINSSSNSEDLLDQLMQRSKNSYYLSKISKSQLKRLIGKLINHLTLAEEPETEINSNDNAIKEDNPFKRANTTVDEKVLNEDFNKVDEVELDRIKKKMDVSFEANRIKPGDDTFQYDLDVEFERVDVDACSWDSNDESDPDF
ncbi:Centrosomal protein of 19 kDa [Trichoplax sp. H2]|nr:Centrosomal protein of 19 kDa [Trichoplax sp. H2]|eukprot:RDD43243.1 Centrosomal protein of 19 kDa [Trichoplax sp. H2]